MRDAFIDGSFFVWRQLLGFTKVEKVTPAAPGSAESYPGHGRGGRGRFSTHGLKYGLGLIRHKSGCAAGELQDRESAPVEPQFLSVL